MNCFTCWKSGTGRIAPGTEELLAEQREGPVNSPPKVHEGQGQSSLPKLKKRVGFEVLSAPKLQKEQGFEANPPPRLLRSVGFDAGDTPVVFSQPLSQSEVLPDHLVQGTEEGATKVVSKSPGSLSKSPGTSNKSPGSPGKKEAWTGEQKKSKMKSSVLMLSPISERDTPIAEASSHFLLQPAESNTRLETAEVKREAEELPLQSTQLNKPSTSKGELTYLTAASQESKSLDTRAGSSLSEEGMEILPVESSSSLHVTDIENLEAISISQQDLSGEVEAAKLSGDVGKEERKLSLASAACQVVGMAALPGAVQDATEELATCQASQRKPSSALVASQVVGVASFSGAVQDVEDEGELTGNEHQPSSASATSQVVGVVARPGAVQEAAEKLRPRQASECKSSSALADSQVVGVVDLPGVVQDVAEGLAPHQGEERTNVS